jgi:hypothetical protein
VGIGIPRTRSKWYSEKNSRINQLLSLTSLESITRYNVDSAPVFAAYWTQHRPTLLSAKHPVIHLHLPTFPFDFSKSTRTHHRTPSLSSTSSATISSTEDELPTDNEGASPPSGNKDVEIDTDAEDDDDIHYVDMPKTPTASAMTPTTPTDRFTRLSVCARRMKGDRFLPKRLRSSGNLRDDFHGLAGMSPRSVSAPVYDPPASPSPLPIAEPKMLTVSTIFIAIVALT